MRRLFLVAAAAALSSCSQPLDRERAEAPPAPTPIVRACNVLEPDMSRTTLLAEEVVATAARAHELAGGPIAPGIYDLVRGARSADAPAWADPQSISIEVSEGPGGVLFNWAQAGATGEAQRWTATFHQGPPAQLSFSCGREGQAPIAFAVRGPDLELELPSGEGRQRLTLTRRT